MSESKGVIYQRPGGRELFRPELVARDVVNASPLTAHVDANGDVHVCIGNIFRASAYKTAKSGNRALILRSMSQYERIPVDIGADLAALGLTLRQTSDGGAHCMLSLGGIFATVPPETSEEIAACDAYVPATPAPKEAKANKPLVDAL